MSLETFAKGPEELGDYIAERLAVDRSTSWNRLIDRLKLDDPVGAIAVHLVCGVWGTLAVGLFGNLASTSQFISQLIGVAAYAIICVLTSFIIIFTLKKTVGIRVSEREELEGLDAHEHGMDAYPDFRLNEH